MITWLQTRFQKGYQFLFLALLAIVIVAFVFTIGAQPSGPGGRPSLEQTDFFGYNMATQRGQQDLQIRGQYSYFFRYGEFPRSADYFYQRALFAGLARDIGLQPPTENELIAFIRTRRAFQNQQGRFDREIWQEFIEDLQTNPNLSESDAYSILAEDFMAERMGSLLAGPSPVREAEVRRQWAAQHIQWTIETASFELDRIQYEGEPTEEELQEFYEENLGRYEIPMKRVMSYTEVRAEDFMDQVAEPSEDDLRRHFSRHPHRFPDPREEEENEEEEENGETEALEEIPDEETDHFDRVRQEVLDDFLLTQARQLANRFITSLAIELWDLRNDPEGITELLEENQLPRISLEPVRDGNMPDEVDWPREFRTNINRLTTDRPISDPIAHQETFLILFLDGEIPPSYETFEDIRDQVMEDFIEEQTRALRAENTTSWREALAASLEDEESSFEEKAASLDLTYNLFEEFSFADAPEELPRQILFQLSDLRQGEISELFTTNGQGYLVHLKVRQVPTEPEDPEEIVSRLEMLRNMVGDENPENIARQLMQRYAPFLLEQEIL